MQLVTSQNPGQSRPNNTNPNSLPNQWTYWGSKQKIEREKAALPFIIVDEIGPDLDTPPKLRGVFDGAGRVATARDLG